MKQLRIKPEIHLFNTCDEFIDNSPIGKEDLVITIEETYVSYFEKYKFDANIIFLKNYGNGVSSDESVC